MSKNLLPDSRLKDRNKLTIMGDWPMPDGSTVRVELSPVFCVGCGKPYGYVPKDNTVGATYICDDCYREDEECFTGMVVSDEQFVRDVAHEMVAKYGRPLTDLEVYALLEQDKLSRELKALIKDSPYKVYAS